MSNTKHTPGPWVSSPTHPREVRSTVVNGTAKRISLAVNNEAIGDEEAIANAKLIAAAPELLEILSTIYTVFKNAGFAAGGHYKHYFDKAKEAIKKATE